MHGRHPVSGFVLLASASRKCIGFSLADNVKLHLTSLKKFAHLRVAVETSSSRTHRLILESFTLEVMWGLFLDWLRRVNSEVQFGD